MRRDKINELIDALLTEAECYEDEMYRQGYTDGLEDLKESINTDIEMALSILEGEDRWTSYAEITDLRL